MGPESHQGRASILSECARCARFGNPLFQDCQLRIEYPGLIACGFIEDENHGQETGSAFTLPLDSVDSKCDIA
jgi:hypothetical protein